MNWIKANAAFGKNIYFVLSNTLILLSILVLCAHIILTWKNSNRTIDFASKLPAYVRAEYRHMTDKEVNELLTATWNNPNGGFAYDEWFGFKEVARQSKFVNVNEYGVRLNDPKPMPMNSIDGAIWVFGGSTTFGYGIADSETIPAVIQKITNQRVINFGRGYFYSAQENLLLSRLLQAGYKPKTAIFLDGINERCGIGVYQPEMGALFDKVQKPYNWSLRELVGPINFALYNRIHRNSIDIHPDNKNDIQKLTCTSFGMEQSLSVVHRINLLERENICSQHKLDCKTFVQPFAGVHGVHRDFDLLPRKERDILLQRFELLKDNWLKFGAIFVVDALDSKRSHSYVDDVHYSYEASELIAHNIAKHLR